MDSDAASTPPVQSAKLERRRRIRFPLHAPCRFWASCADEGSLFGTGTTIDVSMDGIRVAARGLRRGTLITVEVDLPRLEPSWAGRLCDLDENVGGYLPLRGEGRVVWEESSKGEFAALVCFCTLHTLDGQLPRDTEISEEPS